MSAVMQLTSVTRISQRVVEPSTSPVCPNTVISKARRHGVSDLDHALFLWGLILNRLHRRLSTPSNGHETATYPSKQMGVLQN